MVLRTISRSRIGGAVAFFLLIFPLTATADGYPDVDDYADDGFGMDLSAYAMFNLAYHGFGVGAGAQFAYPILPTGFFGHPRHRDALHVEGGLDFFYWDSVSRMVFAPNVGPRYALYLTTHLALFASLKAGVGVDENGDSIAFFWSGSVGAMWDLSDLFSVRFDFGWGRYSDVFRIGILLRF
jgi:hypothetical protein